MQIPRAPGHRVIHLLQQHGRQACIRGLACDAHRSPGGPGAVSGRSAPIVVRVLPAVVPGVVVAVMFQVHAISTAPTSLALAAASCSSAERAAWRLAISDPTTNSTPEQPCETTAASATAITGGESSTTQSKCSLRLPRKSLNRCEPSNSAGLGGTRPEGRSHKPPRRSCVRRRWPSRSRP